MTIITGFPTIIQNGFGSRNVSLDTSLAEAGTLIQAALDAQAALGGGEVILGPGTWPCTTKPRIASKTKLRGSGMGVTILQPSAALAVNANFIQNATISALHGTRDDVKITISDLTIDGSVRSTTWAKWLSKLDGTPVTDPEADYVPVTGALASGIVAPTFTCNISGGAITSITVNTGGSGFKTHPTFPYLASTVDLKITGDGSGAIYTATIVGGAITATTKVYGGTGYTTATAQTVGGYADINLLVDPSSNRRNPNFATVGFAILLGKVDSPVIERVEFVDYANSCISEQGCLDTIITRNKFTRCLKDDAAFNFVFSNSYGNALAPPVYYQDSENTEISWNTGDGAHRLPFNFSPTKGGKLINNYVDGFKEGFVLVGGTAMYNGGTIDIDNNVALNGDLVAITNSFIEATNSRGHIRSRNNLIQSLAAPPFNMAGSPSFEVSGNVCIDNYKETPNGYDPIAERYSFLHGSNAIAGRARPFGLGLGAGTLGTLTNGNKHVRHHHNTYIDTRAAGPAYWFQAFRSGGANLSFDTLLELNNFTSVAAMSLIDQTTFTSVYADANQLIVRNNYPYDLPGGKYYELMVSAQGANFTMSIPAGYVIAGGQIFVRNLTANAITGGLKIGTTSGATDVIAALAVGANAIAVGSASIVWFSATAAQTLFLQAVTGWNSASIDVIVPLVRGII